MPIWSKPDDQHQARNKKATFKGQTVHFAIDPNLTVFPDRPPHPGQDRAFVTDMPNVPGTEFKRIMADVMEAGHKEAIKPPGYDGALSPNGDSRTNGSTTGTLTLYDPQRFTWDVGTKGDSHAFVLLDDGTSTVAIRVSSGEGISKFMFDNSMSQPVSHKPVREADYQMGSYPRHIGTIDLKQLTDEAVTTYELNRTTLKMHLIVASDGILKPSSKIHTKEDEEIAVGQHYNNAKRAPNKAAAMLHSAIDGGSHDNLSLVMIEDIRQGKGKPIAATVCDGCHEFGYVVAERVINAMQQTVRAEIARFNPPYVARSYSENPGKSHKR